MSEIVRKIKVGRVSEVDKISRRSLKEETSTKSYLLI